MTYIDSIKLREMANSWKDIKKDLESHLFVMFEHLVKVYYYHDYEGYLQGWIASIRKGFEHIKKLSNTNKYPTKDQLFSLIWNEWLDGEIDNLHKSIVKDLNRFYDEVPQISDIDYEGFRNFAINYCKYLSEIVSENGGIDMSDIYDYIVEYFE